MNNIHRSIVPLAVTFTLLGAAPVLRADQPPSEDKNEIVVFGGISLLDVSRSGQVTYDGQNLGVSGMHFPVRFGRQPVPIPPVTIEGETSLGSSVLFGARYSRLIKERLALEADLAIAPSHGLETHGRGCVGDVCVDTSGLDRDGMYRFERGFGGRDVTAWHYGGGLAYEITGGDVRPFVLLGAGAVTWDGAAGARTDFALRFGGGLKILFGRVGARVDVVDHLVLDQFLSGKTEHDVHATAGLLVRF